MVLKNKLSKSEERQQWPSLERKGKGKEGNSVSNGLNNRSHRVILLIYCIYKKRKEKETTQNESSLFNNNKLLFNTAKVVHVFEL